jgi:hypothetical protein
LDPGLRRDDEKAINQSFLYRYIRAERAFSLREKDRMRE